MLSNFTTYNNSSHRISCSQPNCNDCFVCAAAGSTRPPALLPSCVGQACRALSCTARPPHDINVLLVRFGLIVDGVVRHERAGRVRVEVDGYAVQDGGLRVTPPPASPSSAAQAAAMALRCTTAPASDALAAHVAGGMRLSLSQQVCTSNASVAHSRPPFNTN